MPAKTTPVKTRIAPCLWFDSDAEEAANFYVGIFPNARIVSINRYGKEGFEIHGRPEGSVMTVIFELDGQRYTALNGGPIFRFNEAISLQVYCETQEELDGYWERLSEGGDEAAQQCGWLKDKYGLSWQIVPRAMDDMMADTTTPGGQRAFRAMMGMKKLDIAALEKAYKG